MLCTVLPAGFAACDRWICRADASSDTVRDRFVPVAMGWDGTGSDEPGYPIAAVVLPVSLDRLSSLPSKQIMESGSGEGSSAEPSISGPHDVRGMSLAVIATPFTGSFEAASRLNPSANRQSFLSRTHLAQRKGIPC